MSVADAVAAIIDLNVPERARAVREILDSFTDDGPLAERERVHLERILADELANPRAGRDWEEIEAELIAQEST